MEKWNRSSTEDSCSYSLSEMYGIDGEINHELHYSILEVHGISKDIEQELNRGLLLIFLIRNAWK